MGILFAQLAWSQLTELIALDDFLKPDFQIVAHVRGIAGIARRVVRGCSRRLSFAAGGIWRMYRSGPISPITRHRRAPDVCPVI
jgi:hypothetical protein